MSAVTRPVVLAFALLAGLASVASATTTVSYTPSGGLTISPLTPPLSVTGPAPSPDKLQMTSPGSDSILRTITAQPGSAPMSAGPGCRQVDATTVQCDATGAQNITANLGSEDDTLLLFVFAGGCVCRGGTGSDSIFGTPGADALDGEAGNDRLRGDNGNDALEGGPGNDTLDGGIGSDALGGGDGNDTFQFADSGADVVSGGAGSDTAAFFGPAGVSVSLDDVANDFSGSNVRSDVENVVGDLGNDTLVGKAPGNRLEGKAGNDTLRGGSPGRRGSAVLSIADDTLDGGAGTDVLLGEGGNDTLLARDGVNDQAGTAMSCGDGIDTLVADLKDDDTRPLPADCENVDQSDRREGPNVVVRSRSLPVARGGPLAVRLSCPRTLRSRCEGTLAARVDAAGAGFGPRTRYSIRPGRSATVSVGLPGGQRAAARRRGARIGLRSLERGRHGTKTTLRSVAARRA